ncbi:hypothetical protein NQ314_005946 [Rhamnusium bicolor]|uniref:SAM-dependent MTase RsmB/NOP-type domain-containing protein n=1 Tax=Rhamnusium bicolor TaxID=1586634 RepID=A0AAV8ZAQ5_9CUCU|nr:hypothetical protein NQ314_005946 [Rhamnusium bicolor]
MPYPDSPFVETFKSQLVTCLSDEKSDTTISNAEYERTLRWLCSSPRITSYRINTLKSNTEEILQALKKHVSEVLGESLIKIDIHPSISDVIVIHNNDINEKLLERHDKQIVVDVDCAAALLRGAHVYAPGVMAMMSGTQINDEVSVFADASRKCKKGLQKLYKDENKIFIGNGVVKMKRHELFGENLNPSGIAIEITETISGCPPLGDHFLPPGSALLQNLPSILCVHALNPQPNENIIDMCASPGNKTTHIAELMQNKGVLIAIDKTSKRVTQLKKRCDEFGAKAYIFEADSSKILSLDSVDCSRQNSIKDGPPFLPETFDKVLLDAPCSVLGKRPQLVNRLSEKMIKSYVPLQRKLFETAVTLLKTHGTLVYSTCTITLAENEGMVAWALRTFKCLELVRPSLCLGGQDG